MIVVDTNIITYYLTETEHTEAVVHFRKFETRWAVPYLWRSEFRNTLWQHIKHHRMTEKLANYTYDKAMRLVGKNEFNVSTKAVLKLAQQSNCAAYDCEFVALAYELKTVLVTLDQKLINAFPKISINPHDIISERPIPHPRKK